MEKVLSKYEQFIKDRDDHVIKMFVALSEAGTAKMTCYRTIGESLSPPLHDTAIMRILRKHGFNRESSSVGRPRKLS